jgi:hypothetical protein
MSIFYINTEDFSTATSVYSNIELTNKAPDGFYSFNNVYRKQVAGILREVFQCPLVCKLAAISTTTTNPTNTATITFTGAIGACTYTVNGVEKGVATSPLLIPSLLPDIEYTVIIKDSNNCTAKSIFKLGSFSFDADYIMITYEFTNGRDLDTRSRIVIPNIGQDTQAKYLGWGVLNVPGLFPPSDPIISFGGDNLGIGFESVLIDLKKLKLNYPTENILVADFRGFWHNTGLVGTNPVNVDAVMWKGGTIIKDGFKWENPTALSVFNIDSVGKQIFTQTGNSGTSGDRIATLTYNLTTGEGVLNNNDTTTPSI